MMTASIAFQRLNPRARAQAQALLALYIKPAAITAKSTDFVNASHWADDLRPFSRNLISSNHVTSSICHFQLTALLCRPTCLIRTNIVKALGDSVEILKTSTDKNARAQALRFIIHFVGDIHQPLHCATRVDNANLHGDLGGNNVKIKIGGNDVSLHSYWDGGIGDFPKSGPNYAPPPLSEIGPRGCQSDGRQSRH
jgi:hypothetical protein